MSKKRIKKKVNYDYLFIVIAVLLFVGFLFFIFYFLNFNPVDTTKIFVSANLTNSVGFDLNKTALTFGNVVLDNSASRKITLQNNLDERISISIISRGEIAPYLSVSDNEFFILPNEERVIDFFVFFPNGTELNYYSGEVEIVTTII